MFVTRAPGRVNLIGDHTDYQGGFCLPMAIDLEVTMTVSIRSDGRVVATSDQLPEPVDLAADGSEDALMVHPPWGRPIAAALTALHERDRTSTGFDATISSTVPVGSGLSSSAAFSVAAVLTAAHADGMYLAPRDTALLAQHVDHHAYGVPCGVMDHMASACGRAGHTLLLDCFSLTLDYVPVPDAITVIVAHSGEARVLETSEYAQRAEACAAAAARIGVPALHDATADQVADDPIARHVVSENARVLAFVAALKAGDFTTAGAVMDASHTSFRDDYRVSTSALDDVVARFRATGAYGARLTGAGFGGCAVALVPADRVQDVVAAIEPHYRVFSVSAADGANIIS